MVSLSHQNPYLTSRNMNSSQFDDSDFPLYPEHQLYSQDLFAINNNIQNFTMDATVAPYDYQRNSHESYPAVSEFASTPMFPTTSQQTYAKQSPNLYPIGSPDRAPPSSLSTASGASATSSAMGSPYSGHGQVAPATTEWQSHGLGVVPSIVGDFGYTEYNFGPSGMEEFAFTDLNKPHGYVDPSILNSYASPQAPSPMPNVHDVSGYQQQTYSHPQSPTPSHNSTSSRHIKQGSQSPFLHNSYAAYPYPPPRRTSIASQHSYTSLDGSFDSDDSKRGRCPNPECGKVFKDLKAHMLTHQNERPEKCPIQTCDYHTKGFARKYDKNRHTLTHYKGTMVCGFCPGSGSAAEKSFNRADVFKRHLTSVHAVEQTPPNSRKKTSGGLNAGKKLAGYAPDATGKCSTCSATFSNAQDFYEHLDDCVLRIVQQEDPSEAINARRLAEVENDPAVLDTLRANALPTTTVNPYSADDEDDAEEYDDADDDDYTGRSKAARRGNKTRIGSNGGIQKSRGMTLSKGGVPLHNKGRKKRKDYPTSWGCASTQMKMKKRVMCAFDGTHRLWKDDMMLSSDYDVRIPLADGKSYVTDLDIQTLKRAEAFHNATPEEKGDYGSDDMSSMDLVKLMEMKAEE